MDLLERRAALAAGEAGGARHPWETERFRFLSRIALSALRESFPQGQPVSVLDVGAGDGWFAARLLAQLPAGSRVVCWDTALGPAAAEVAHTPGLHFTAAAPTVPFELVLALDVLEHVRDDRQFLAEIVRWNLAPGGVLLASFPAWPAIFSSHDRFLGHFRRYSPAEAKTLLRGPGLRIRRCGGLFASLLLVRALALLKERALGEPGAPAHLGTLTPGPLLRGALTALLRFDAAISLLAMGAGVELPGLSWWATCKKQS